MAVDLPGVWRAAATTPAERQRIVRHLAERVSVIVDKASEQLDVGSHPRAAQGASETATARANAVRVLITVIAKTSAYAWRCVSPVIASRVITAPL